MPRALASLRQVFTALTHLCDQAVRLCQAKRVQLVSTARDLYIARGLRLVNGQGKVVAIH